MGSANAARSSQPCNARVGSRVCDSWSLRQSVRVVVGSFNNNNDNDNDNNARAPPPVDFNDVLFVLSWGRSGRVECGERMNRTERAGWDGRGGVRGGET